MRSRFQAPVGFHVLLVLAACAPADSRRAAHVAAEVQRTSEAGQETRLRADLPRVVFLGDSLTAGFGLPRAEAYPALLESHLAGRGLEVSVVNAGVSGDTTAGGLARLDWLLRQDPAVLVVALGANDGLRGLSLKSLESNLRAIVTGARSAGAAVLLCGMRMPPNYGEDYTEGFAAVFSRVAEDLEVPLVPFLLEGVAAREELNLDDGMHPNSAGQARVAENVAPALEKLLRD